MGLIPAQVRMLSWREFFLSVEAFQERQDMEWQRTREIVAMLYNLHVKKNARMSAKKLMPLPSDKKITKDESKLSTVEKFLEACIKMKIKIPFPYDSPSGKKYR